MSFDLNKLSNAQLEELHKSLHADVYDPVKVQAHHLVTTELLVRGLDHGHSGDEWNRAVIEVGVENNVPVNKAFNGIPADVVDTVNAELGYPDLVSKTTILTVDGYTLKFDTVKKEGEPEDRLNPTQNAIYEFLESLTEAVGKFNQSSDANGAHYMEDNPFVDEGLMCANCIFYEGGGGCEIVEGQIDHMALCKFWVIPEDLLNGMSKHMQGKHDQSTHGDWAHGSSVSASDFQMIGKTLSKKSIRLSYNEGYGQGLELKRTNSNPFAIPAVMKRHEELHGLLDEFRKNQHWSTSPVYADQIVTDAGFFDALNGAKRRYRRLLVDPVIPQLSTVPLLKHGHHDQKTHGNWAHGGASENFADGLEIHDSTAWQNFINKSVDRTTVSDLNNRWAEFLKTQNVVEVKRNESFDPETYDWGYGSNRPEVLAKPRTITYKGEEISADTTGLWHYLMDDGNGNYIYTPEREALHAEIIKEALKGIPRSSDPTFTMMGGGGGSGKGTIRRNQQALELAKEHGVILPEKGKAVIIDADELKAKLPDFQVFVDNGRKLDVAGWTHEESSDLGKAIDAAATKAGMDIFLDGTGNSSEASLGKKIAKARNAGYKVNGCYVSASIDLAWKQNMQRAIEDPNRGLVPANNFLANHKSVSSIMPKMSKEFDNFVLFDTNHDTRPEGAPPVLIASTKKGGVK